MTVGKIKVYVVVYRDDNDTHIDDVFTFEDLAYAYIEKQPTEYRKNLDIEEFIANEEVQD